MGFTLSWQDLSIFLLAAVLIAAVMGTDWQEFFSPIGCPKCGAPEPPFTGWVRCDECGLYYER